MCKVDVAVVRCEMEDGRWKMDIEDCTIGCGDSEEKI